jgi:hypothetical protein
MFVYRLISKCIQYLVQGDVNTSWFIDQISFLKVTWHENLTLRFSNINMSFPSLPMVPQWLNLAFGVKRARGILLRLWKKWKLKRADLECGPICHHRGPRYLAFLCPARPENLARQWDNELRACGRHVRVHDCTHCNAAFGVMAHNPISSGGAHSFWPW